MTDWLDQAPNTSEEPDPATAFAEFLGLEPARASAEPHDDAAAVAESLDLGGSGVPAALGADPAQAFVRWLQSQ